MTVTCRCCIDALRCRSRPSEQTDTKVCFSCHTALRRFSSLFMREPRVSLKDTLCSRSHSTPHASSPLFDFKSTHRCRHKLFYFSNAMQFRNVFFYYYLYTIIVFLIFWIIFYNLTLRFHFRFTNMLLFLYLYLYLALIYFYFSVLVILVLQL